MSTEVFSKRLMPSLAVVVNLTIALLLFISRHHEYSGSFFSTVTEHRATVGLLLNVVSSVLSILQVFVICSMVNFAFRTRLFRKPTGLSALSLWSAISSARIELRLPLLKAVILCLVALIGPALAAVWAGALTPVLTTGSLATEARVPVTLYPTSEYSTFVLDDIGAVRLAGYQFSFLDGRKSRQISSCPGLNLMDGFLTSASTASSLTEHRIHPKLNNDTWSFQDRSYGVGSAIGIYNQTRSCGLNCVSFVFEETGYSTSVTCTKRNDTTILFGSAISDAAVLVLRSEEVVLPGGATSPIPSFQIARNKDSGVVCAWSANSSADLGHYLITLDQTGGADAKYLNVMFCQMVFTPTRFKVTAFLETNLILVEPQTNAATHKRLPVFDLTRAVSDQIIKDLDLLSRASASMVLSAFTNAITSSLLVIKATHVPQLGIKRVAEIAMEISVTALIDDLLLARGAA